MSNKTRFILPIIVISQFCCTSLWFAGNGVMNNLVEEFNLNSTAIGHLTSAVQFGFISGTLLFALLTIADRYSPSKVFFISALFGALFNLGMMLNSNGLFSLIAFRFLTGFFLAGIYPIGMKIAADYFEKGLGKTLGFLVGALVIGTAFPHLLKGLITALNWKLILIGTSCLATLGGLLMYLFVPNGPYRNPSQKLDLLAFFKVFKERNFRSAAFGYFGHMWELYAFWAFVPIILSTYKELYPEADFDIAILSFTIIGIGSIACVIGGYLSLSFGAKRTATIALLLSCLCCLISPIVFEVDSEIIVLGYLMFWGMVVIADSPLFSTLVANNAPSASKGTALTIVNCVGYSITIISIQLLTLLREIMNPTMIYLTLAIGPILGLYSLMRLRKNKQ